jgi:MFS family permease
MTTITTRPAGREILRPVRTTAILVVLLTAQLMAIIDVNAVNVAGATVRADLHSSGAGLQSIIASYMITYAIALITGARLGGRYGHRRMFLYGLAIFTAASLACGLAGTTAVLVGFRIAQGAGASLMIPQVFSLIQRHFIGPARVRALARYAAVVSVGVVVGQVLGGLLVSADLFGSGWRPVFWINVPIGIALLAYGPRVLPVDETTSARRLDVTGLVTLAASVLTFIVPLLYGQQEGWPVWCWIGLGAAVAIFAGFVALQRRAAEPLISGRVVRAPGMVPSLSAMFLMMAAYGGFLFTVALHLQNGLGFSPLRAGLTFAPMAVMFGVASLQWRRLPAAWHPWLPPVGMVVGVAGEVAMGLALAGGHRPGALFFAAGVPFSCGFGTVVSPLMARALGRVKPADASDASGLVTTVIQLAQAVGLAAIGSVYLAYVPAHGSARAVAIATGVEAVIGVFAAVCAIPRRASAP